MLQQKQPSSFLLLGTSLRFTRTDTDMWQSLELSLISCITRTHWWLLRPLGVDKPRVFNIPATFFRLSVCMPLTENTGRLLLVFGVAAVKISPLSNTYTGSECYQHGLWACLCVCIGGGGGGMGCGGRKRCSPASSILKVPCSRP